MVTVLRPTGHIAGLVLLESGGRSLRRHRVPIWQRGRQPQVLNIIRAADVIRLVSQNRVLSSRDGDHNQLGGEHEEDAEEHEGALVAEARDLAHAHVARGVDDATDGHADAQVEERVRLAPAELVHADRGAQATDVKKKMNIQPVF